MNKDTGPHKTTDLSSEVQGRDSELSLWSTHREESVFFQREAQVNFWTVLGGLAMAALLTQLSPLLREIQSSRWYLTFYMVASILILAISWVQTSWGSLILKWPISIVSTVIVLFEMLAQSIQCLLITNPAGWLAATAGLVFFSLLLQMYFAMSGAWKVFSVGSIKHVKFNNGVYAFFVFICLAGASHLHFFPSNIAETIWGAGVLLLSFLALYMQHKAMQKEKLELSIP